jgi:hypothetical protein
VANAIRNYTTATGSPSEVNPNRNFPDIDGNPHPDGNPWWPETEAMMALAESKRFALAANFHGGIEVVNYPWDSRQLRHPDDAWLRRVARAYADRAQSDSPGGYMTDLDNGITNGWDWYPIFGGRQDYTTFFHATREFTIELSETKLLPADELEDYWLWNRGALLAFISRASEGIRGIVTDLDGNPLAATVEIVGLDAAGDGAFAATDPAVGDYHRLLMPGTYDLRVRASGCLGREIAGIAVVDGDATVVDVELPCAPFIRRANRRFAPRARMSVTHR